MKPQYLGDSKDSFKWDYHDFLTATLGYSILNVILMLTPDDGSSDGASRPENFPARKPVIEFCNNLKKQRKFQLIRKLPFMTGATYAVKLHKGRSYLTSENRREYFSGICAEKRQVLFLDPDNGFQPGESNNDKYVLYTDIEAILEQVSEEAVISVFQHFRRITFDTDFTYIKQRLLSGRSTALYWHSLMFVAISKSRNTLEKVRKINRRYSKQYPVKVLY